MQSHLERQSLIVRLVRTVHVDEDKHAEVDEDGSSLEVELPEVGAGRVALVEVELEVGDVASYPFVWCEWWCDERVREVDVGSCETFLCLVWDEGGLAGEGADARAAVPGRGKREERVVAGRTGHRLGEVLARELEF